MANPTVSAFINFSTGPSFGQTMILDVGLLDTAVLGDSASLIVDVSDKIDKIETQRGRNVLSDTFQTGTLSLRLIDQNGDFNPQNTLGPYYGLLSPMRKVTISGTHLGITYPIFSGYITSYNYMIPNNTTETVGYTTITAVDAFRLANLATVTSISGAVAGELTGARIGHILDEISWPSSMRDIDPGLTTVQADPGTSRTTLAALQTIEATEYGALYVDTTGRFVFQDRSLTSTSVSATPTVFNDNGTAIDYFDAIWRLDDSQVYNSANVTRLGGTLQNATNSASIALYFLHSVNYTGLLMESDAEALNLATAYVGSRAETTTRCDALILDLRTENYDAGITAALSLDFFSPVTISTSQPGGTTLTKTEQVFGISHSITPNSWRTTFMTLEPIIDAFILDSSLYGVLDTSVLSY